MADLPVNTDAPPAAGTVPPPALPTAGRPTEDRSPAAGAAASAAALAPPSPAAPMPETHTQPEPAPAAAAQPKPAPHGGPRELLETVAFVVTLVLLLKLFVVEAFVIPTGSMAETLYGYQKRADCPECGFAFPVNSSSEVEGQDGRVIPVVGATCPNCRKRFAFEPPRPTNASGDRVLVHKAIYHRDRPAAGDVVVFKYPVDPQVQHTAQNYIKRLWGRGGETLAINRGDLYRTTALGYPADAADPDSGARLYPRPADPAHAWEGPEAAVHSKAGFRGHDDYTYHRAAAAVAAFDRSRAAGFPPDGSGFELVRKPDDLALAMRRVVYDADHPPRTPARNGAPPRWAAEANWIADDRAAPKAFTHAGGGLDWVRYRHLAPRTGLDWERLTAGGAPPARPVDNFLGYNTAIEPGGRELRNTASDFWVGDLLLDCEVELGAADAEVVVELSKGPRRYQAWFRGGRVELIRTGANDQPLPSAATPVTGPGTYRLRFANVDCRLRVWVNDAPVDFGGPVDYPPDPLPEAFEPTDTMEEGWTVANDVAAPAGVGAKGPVTVRHLVLWRDTYFTYADGRATGVANFVDTFYVQPGHYFCLGDNSAQSSDSRKWGSVPERLLLGKAVGAFWPLPRIGPIR